MELLKTLRLLGDESRLRLLRLLQREELSVAELQEILGMGQSRISMQLAPLKQAGLIDVRRQGQKSLYRWNVPPDAAELLTDLLRRASAEIPESAADDAALDLILDRRKDRLRGYFDELAGRFGRDYVPGRSWKSTAEMLLRLLPPLTIADLGAGEGTLTLLLAQRAKHIIAVDSAPKMVEYGRDLLQRGGVENVEYRLGDLESLPIDDASVDLALLHQTLHHALHPAKAIAEAARILRPGGRIMVVDLNRHEIESARELYGDVWLGFSQAELMGLLREAGFAACEVNVVYREPDAPGFETVLAVGEKGAS